MKSFKLLAILTTVATSVASCDLLSEMGAPHNEDSSKTDNTSEVRQVESIQMSYVDNREMNGMEYKNISYLQSFTYDETGKCTNIKIDYEDTEKDDLNCAITYEANKLKMDITGYHYPLSYEFAMDNGRAKYWIYDEDRAMTFEYNSNGYLYRIAEWCPEHVSVDGGCGYVAFNNINGLCTGAYFDVHPESAVSPDDALIWNESSWYPHRYLANKTSINLNTHIINGAIQYDFNPWEVLNTIGCLGKVSDCLFERTYGFLAEVGVEYVPGPLDEPNKTYKCSHEIFKEKYDDYDVTLEVDEEGYVKKFSYIKVYEKFRVDYYYQTSNVRTEFGYEYIRSENTYTKIGNDISCPVSVIINYSVN